MTSVRYTKFRDIDLSVLQIIRSTHRGGDLSALVKWGKETGFLSQTKLQKQTQTMLHLICENCGKHIDRHLYQQRKALTQNSQDAYCGVKCRGEHHAIKNRRRCAQCGERCLKKTNRYCSQLCKLRARPSRGDAKQIIYCGICGTQCKTGYLFCSRKCASNAHSRRMRGARNSKFRGNGRYSSLFQKMRVVVLARDGEICTVCMTPNKIVRPSRPRSVLQVHHIDDNTKNNVPENLLTLCERCHKRHHHGVLEMSKEFPDIAKKRTMSMTSKLKDTVISLLMEYSFITA